MRARSALALLCLLLLFTPGKGMKFLLDTIADSNPKAKNAKPEDFVNTSLLKEIESSDFVKQLSGK